jgi:hypothetical protein
MDVVISSLGFDTTPKGIYTTSIRATLVPSTGFFSILTRWV